MGEVLGGINAIRVDIHKHRSFLLRRQRNVVLMVESIDGALDNLIDSSYPDAKGWREAGEPRILTVTHSLKPEEVLTIPFRGFSLRRRGDRRGRQDGLPQTGLPTLAGGWRAAEDDTLQLLQALPDDGILGAESSGIIQLAGSERCRLGALAREDAGRAS